LSKFQHTTWYGLEALSIESNRIRLCVVPQLGGKIVSINDKHVSHEWLVGPVNSIKPLSYGASFIDQDMSGWDEMFPNITGGSYPAPGPYYNQPLPDHGEVWSLPWTVEAASPEQIVMSVRGRVLPYKLVRTAHISGTNTFIFKYQVTNLGPEPFHYLWTAHPQFVGGPSIRIVLPDAVNKIVNALASPTWDAAGTRYDWPETYSADNQHWHLDRMGLASLNDCRKFYLPPESPINQAILANLDLKCTLTMQWVTEELPYLGIWIDEGAYNANPVIALEPANGFFDNLSLAYKNKRLATIAAGETQSWELSVKLSGIRDHE